MIDSSGGDTFSEPTGTYTYPTGPGYDENAANLVELRVRPRRVEQLGFFAGGEAERGAVAEIEVIPQVELKRHEYHPLVTIKELPCWPNEPLWEQIKDKASVVYPIENFFYGIREFAIRDNNGYVLQFGQEISDPAQIPPPED